MSTYVLVHGAWSGAHGFRDVRRLLQAQGHTVFTPSLTGIGERSHLASAQITLDTHIQDVANQVLYEDLQDIILLGFSYGGMVVTGSLAHIAERVKHLVFLDAFVPQDGESVMDLVSSRRPPSGLGAPAFLPPAPRQYARPEDAAFHDPRRSPQPLGTFAQAVRLHQALEAYPFTRTYIRATEDDHSAESDQRFAEAAERARTSPHWRHHELPSNHMVPMNLPEALTEILLNLR